LPNCLSDKVLSHISKPVLGAISAPCTVTSEARSLL